MGNRPDIVESFIKASSGVFEPRELMEAFFSTVAASFEFDAAAYVISSGSLWDGHIYAREGVNVEKIEGLKRRLKESTKGLSDLPSGIVEGLGVTRIPGKAPAADASGCPLESAVLDLPLIRGNLIGLAFLSLRSATGALTGKDHGLAPLIEALSALLEKVLERKSGEEARLEGILSGIAEGVYVIDGAGKLCSVNPRGAELITGFCPNGLECVKKGRAGLRPHQRDGCPLAAVIASLKGLHAGRGTTHSEEIRNNEGNVLHLSAREIDGGYVVTTRDATEESFLRERAYHSGRLSTIGEMTAGIAHEINNPLQMVMANVELLAEAAAGDGFASRKLGNIKDGILRIRGIVANLLLFARGETVKTEDADINTLVANCVDLARHHVKLAGVGIITDLGPGPLTVRCNPNLFQQVILNLLQNSRDAIEGSRKGSKVIVRTRPLEGSVVMEVSDDGPGIPDDITGRIFAPFFTTKDPGKGTGLGLAISKRFIEETGGSISASNGPAGGAVFRVTLPFSGVKNKGAKGLNGASEDAPHDKALPSKGAEVPLEEGECSDCKCAHREEERVEGAVIPLRPGEDKPGICCKTGKPHARKKAR